MSNEELGLVLHVFYFVLLYFALLDLAAHLALYLNQRPKIKVQSPITHYSRFITAFLHPILNSSQSFGTGGTNPYQCRSKLKVNFRIGS